MSDQPDRDVIDDDEHTNPDQEDIGKIDLTGVVIGDDLDVGDLDTLVDEADDDEDHLIGDLDGEDA